MISAVDSNVLLDVFAADPAHVTRSRATLRRCASEGALLACEVVWAEVAAHFPSPSRARTAMEEMGLTFAPIELDAALDAGHRWRAYRRSGGGRGRIVADFLVGAHAQKQADRLLTRDRGFYRAYFQGLVILDPSTG
ncbi:MAG TPA: PIN domain-containing protein [Gemmatimonadota bacterium]|nr:PIN domain-containing protein [Gemmatimonadota bacterium]